jgi:hypothetical protein
VRAERICETGLWLTWFKTRFTRSKVKMPFRVTGNPEVIARTEPSCGVVLHDSRQPGSYRITSGLPTARKLAGPVNTRAFGRSRPAADATREVVERWLLDGLM